MPRCTSTMSVGLRSGTESAQAEPASSQTGGDPTATPEKTRSSRVDVQAALAAARKAEKILAERKTEAARDTDTVAEDLMRRREAEAGEEATARRAAVRQDPSPSRHMTALERDELELEAGH